MELLIVRGNGREDISIIYIHVRRSLLALAENPPFPYICKSFSFGLALIYSRCILYDKNPFKYSVHAGCSVENVIAMFPRSISLHAYSDSDTGLGCSLKFQIVTGMPPTAHGHIVRSAQPRAFCQSCDSATRFYEIDTGGRFDQQLVEGQKGAGTASGYG